MCGYMGYAIPDAEDDGVGFLDGLDTGAWGIVEGENNGVISYLY